METNETPLDPQPLLEQAGWVRSLAEQLVVATDLREDVAQQALLIALERHPSVLNPRAWLTRLVKNTAWESNRSEHRRRFHQQQVVPEEPQESPDQLVAQAELQGRIVVAVTRLEEPYRSTILQRYFCYRSAEDIARIEGVPAVTVRTRLKRALDQLREQFQDEQESHREAWLALLLPVASTETTLLTTASVLTAGGLAMKLGSFFLGLVAVGLAIAIIVIAPWEDRAPASSATADAGTAVPAAPKEAAETTVPTTDEEQLPVTPAEQATTREAVALAGPVLAGQVVDRTTREPVTSFLILISRMHGIGEQASSSRTTIVNQHITDPRGSFRLAVTETGIYRLQVYSRQHISEALDDLRVDGPEGVTDLLVELDPGLAVSGWVVDHVSGRPIEGALVGTTRNSRLEYILAGEAQRCLHTVTDEDGRFRLSGLNAEGQKIAAVHDDYAEAWHQVIPGQVDLVEIRMKRGPRILGTVLDDAGKPKKGVWITLYGDEIPLGRPVVTGPDGTYETPPVRPGTVELYAHPPDGETGDTFGFSAEWEVAYIQDADVRVDFGVRTDYVVWRGTLYGTNGQPLPEANLFIHLHPPSYVDYERLHGHSRNATCDEEGRFEFRKVPLGRYDLRVWNEGDSILDRDVQVILEAPGLHEEDIHLDAEKKEGNCQIRGVVIDGATGMPIETDGFLYVTTAQFSPTFRSWRASVGADGNFLIDGLPAGRTHVSAHAEGWVAGSVTVVLREGLPADELRIVLPRSGTLRLQLADFRESAPREFQFALSPESEHRTRSHDDKLPENGNYEISWPLEPGSWTVTVHFEDLGTAERFFDIDEGRVTEVVIRPEDFVAAPPTIAVEGDVRREDGTPVPGVMLAFWGGDIPGIAEAARSKAGQTDTDGEFEVAGFIPGRWRVRGTIDGTSAVFSDLVIPTGAPDPYPVHLVLPGGRLIGTLLDKRTGLPLGDDAPPRWLFLGRPSGGQNVCEIQGGQTGSLFEMDGIPEGDYVLTVSAQGFSRYSSDPFHHAGNCVLDLGRIELEPCGNLEFDVVDEEGLPVPEFHVYLNGRVLSAYKRKSIGEGRFRLSHLPLGTATLEIRADGFQTSRQDLTFTADAPTRHSFILKGL